MKIGDREFDFDKRVYIMGILNLTPDSFSDGGKYAKFDDAINHARKLVEDGADILDVGGESTRPGHSSISSSEEMDRVIGVIERIKKEIDIPISIDTNKHDVAEEAIRVGADLINDVWGFKRDRKMAEVAKRYGVPCCLMHNRVKPDYKNFLEDCLNDLKGSIDIALDGGVSPCNIIIDPGIGFCKDYSQNIEVLRNLHRFKGLGFPVLLGTSRKKFIGTILNIDTPKDRVEGTIATSIIGVMKGCSILRVHDVLENKRAVMVYEAIMK